MVTGLKKAIQFTLIGFAAGFLTMGSAFGATTGSHYPFGGEGVLAASVPPPGFHYRLYNTLYNPDTLMDDNGDELNVGFDLDLFAQVHRFIHVTKTKIFGADYLWDVIVPVIDKDIQIAAAGLDDSKTFSMGDIIIEPIALAWHKPRFDAVAALALIAPTGEFEGTKPASPGLGYWSGMLTLGGTFFFDAKRTFSFSALTRTLVHTEQEDIKVTPGSEFVVEYGLGKSFILNDTLEVRPGISGSAYWQISDDSDDFGPIVADQRKEAYAVGPEINFFWFPPRLLQVNLRVLREFNAKNTAEGSQFVLTLTQSW